MTLPWTSLWGRGHPDITRALLLWSQTFWAGLPELIPRPTSLSPCPSLMAAAPQGPVPAPPAPSPPQGRHPRAHPPGSRHHPLTETPREAAIPLFQGNLKFPAQDAVGRKRFCLCKAPGAAQREVRRCLARAEPPFPMETPWSNVPLMSHGHSKWGWPQGHGHPCGKAGPAPLTWKWAAPSPKPAGHRQVREHQHRPQPRRCSTAQGCTALNFVGSPECLPQYCK